ncbi:MAG: FlgD immunoglobulin-like domain containing protein [Candidatus Latescibacterota bacterium]
MVADGTLFDLWNTAGEVLSADADPARPGLQVATRGGRLRFPFAAGRVALPADLTALSVVGKAGGHARVELTDAVPPAAPRHLAGAWDGASLVLRWLPSAEPDLAGYRIHFRQDAAGPPYDGSAAPPGLASPVSVGVDTVASLLGLDASRGYHVALTAFDVAGNESAYAVEAVVGPGPTAVGAGDAAARPGAFTLLPSYPNPFNEETVIRYQVPRPGPLDLAVYDLLGQRVRTLARGAAAAGEHVARCDGTDGAGRPVASGVYLGVLAGDGSRQVRHMALVR